MERRVEERRKGGPLFFDTWLQLLLTIAMMVTLFVGLVGLAGLWVVYHGQLTSRDTGYRNRAVNCQVARNLGVALPVPCFDDTLAPYFDRDAPVVRAAPSPTLCAIAVKLQVQASGCP